MASILKVDEMQGVTSAGDITITSEGGAATQSLQQGLLKAWINVDGTGTAGSRDSLNHSSLTDVDTGHYQNNFANVFANDDYSVTAIAAGNGSNLSLTSLQYSQLQETGLYRTRTFNSDNSDLDAEILNAMVAGDLA